MSRLVEFEFFKLLYNEECRRFADLSTRAQVFLSVVSLVLGSLYLKLDLVLSISTGRPVTKALLCISLVCLFASLLSTIMSLRIRSFEAICDPEHAASTLDALENGQDEESHGAAMSRSRSTRLNEAEVQREFISDRIADLVVATNRNSAQNDVRAAWLAWAGNLIVVSFACALLFVLTVVLETEGSTT